MAAKEDAVRDVIEAGACGREEANDAVLEFSVGWSDRAHPKTVVTVLSGIGSVERVVAALNAIDEQEGGYWSANTFERCSLPTTRALIESGRATDAGTAKAMGACDRPKDEPHRSAPHWRAASGLVMDLDWIDPRRAGKDAHQALPEDVRRDLEQRARAGQLPCSWFHASPRGVRMGTVPSRAVTDLELYKAASRRIQAITAEWLATSGFAQTGNTPGLVIDTSVVEDPARIFWCPKSIVQGVRRSNEVLLVNATPVDATALARAAPSPKYAPHGPALAPRQGGTIPSGCRNATLLSIAGTLLNRGVSAEAIEATLLVDNATRCDPPLPDREVLSIARSIRRYEKSDGHVDDPTITIGDDLPADVKDLMSRHRRLQTLFAGSGKPEFDSSGKRLDCSPEGYDFSFGLQLVRRGVIDASTLATALACRPDGYARQRGRAYIVAKVKAVLAAAPASGEAAGQALNVSANAYGVSRVRVYDSDPPRFELEIGGRWISFRTGQLLESGAFRARYFERLRTLISTPKGENAAKDWAAQLNAWMAVAEVITLPGDATTEGALRDAVRRAVAELPVGDCPEDLNDGKGFEWRNGHIIFKTDAILRFVKAYVEKPTTDSVTRHLHELGLKIKTRRIAAGKGGTVKAWLAKRGASSSAASAPAATPSPAPPWPTAVRGPAQPPDDPPPPLLAPVTPSVCGDDADFGGEG